MKSRRPTGAAAVILTAVVLAGCGSSTPRSSPGSLSTADTPPTTASTTSTPDTSTSPAVTATTVATTAATPATSTTTGVSPGKLSLPVGNIVTGPNDLLVVHTDGDLWLHPGALTSNAGVPVRLADFTDPRAPSGPEGSGPNIVEDVAGEVGGVVYYSDCCEPIMGELLASTGENSELIRLGSGYSPALNPERTKLATVNNVQLVVIDLTTGDSQARSLNESSVWIEPWDLIWTRDGAALVVLDFADTEWRLSRFVPDRLFKLDVTAPLGVPFDPESDVFVQLAGRGPDGEIAVVVGDGKTTVLR